jgi:hypothetical protein
MTPAFKKQLLYMVLSTLLTMGLAEGIVRFQDGGMLSQIHCYQPAAEGPYGFIPGCTQKLPSPEGGSWELVVGEDGLRAPSTGSWLIAGDSQVLGMGLSSDKTWMKEVKAKNLGIPGYGVQDALEAAGARVEEGGIEGVIVVVNAANDWEEALKPLKERYTVLGGWLLKPQDAARWAGRFFGTPLTTSHLLVHAVQLIGRDWSRNLSQERFTASPWGMEAEARTQAARKIALALNAFHAQYPELPFYVLILPVDFSTSEERARAVLPASYLENAPWKDETPWTELLTMIPELNKIDLRADLTQAADFQRGDYHLSEHGHARLSARLKEVVP